MFSVGDKVISSQKNVFSVVLLLWNLKKAASKKTYCYIITIIYKELSASHVYLLIEFLAVLEHA